MSECDEWVQCATLRVETDSESLFFSGILGHKGRTRSLLLAGMSDLVVSGVSGTVTAETEELRFVFAEDAVGSVRHTDMRGVEFRGMPFEGDNTVPVADSCGTEDSVYIPSEDMSVHGS